MPKESFLGNSGLFHADSFPPAVSGLLPAHSSSQSQEDMSLQKLIIVAPL